MKLPDESNIYEFNKYIDKLADDAHYLQTYYGTNMNLIDICKHNIRKLNSIKNTIIHLELVLDEVMKGLEK